MFINIPIVIYLTWWLLFRYLWE